MSLSPASARPDSGSLAIAGLSDDTPIVSAHGLRTLTAAFIGLYFGVGVLLLYTFGVFIRPIVETTGWNRTLVTGAIAPAALVIGVMSPVAGWLTDRHGPRRVATASAAAQALGIVLIGLGSTSLGALTLLVALASLLGSAQTPVPYSALLVGWFKRQRGLAMGIALSAGGLGIATFPPLVSLLIGWTDWRSAFVILGLIAFAVTVPVAWLMVVDPPVLAKADQPEVPGTTLAEAMRTPAFWLFLVAFLLNAAAAAGGSISLPGILADRGASPAQAAAALTMVGAAVLVARIGFGSLLDRFPPVAMSALILGAPVIGHLLLLSDGPLWTAVVAALTFGIATGAEGDALSYLVSRRFGMRNFGRIYGFNFLGFAIGVGSGPVLLSAVAERAGYGAAFLTLAAAALAASLLIASQARRPLPYA